MSTPTATADAPGQRPAGIVVGVDGSESAGSALRWALEEGAVRGVPVHVLYVWTRPGVSSPAVPEPGPGEAANALLGGVMSRVGDVLRARTPASPVTSQTVEGRPAAVLIDQATDAQLLVVGTRGSGGFAGLLLGSVSHQCTAHAFCPVVVIHDATTRSWS